MVLSFSSPERGVDNHDAMCTFVESTSVVSFLGVVVLFTVLYRAFVHLLLGKERGRISCRCVLRLWFWKKQVIMQYMCPKRRERYLRCLRRCERRRQKNGDKNSGVTGTSSSGDKSSREVEEEEFANVTCPFSRAAKLYKLHLPAPLPVCGKRERRGSLSSCGSAGAVGAADTESATDAAAESCQTCTTTAPPPSPTPTSTRTPPPCKECQRTTSDSTSASSSTSSSTASTTSNPPTTMHPTPPSSPSIVVATAQSAHYYETPLIDLARMQQWSTILTRGVSRREAKYRDVDGLCALHWACSGGPPVEVVQMMLDAYPSAVKKMDHEGSTPLHFATHYSASPAVVEVLLKLYPKAASKLDKYGRSPLYHAVEKSSCVRIWKMLVNADPTMILTPCLPTASTLTSSTAASTTDSSTPARPAAVRSPLFLAWINVVSNRRARTSCQGRYWEKAVYLLEAAWSHRHQQPSASGATTAAFRLLHAALELDLYLPEQVVTMAIQANPEQLEEQDEVSGLTPIAMAAAMSHYSQGRGHALIRQLLQANSAATGAAAQGRSPLVHAIVSGKVWTAGVQSLAEADPGALQSLDRETLLTPALLAAAAATNDADAEADDYDPTVPEPTYTTRTSLFLRQHLDPFGLLSSKDRERLDACVGSNQSSGGGTDRNSPNSTSETPIAAAQAQPPKLDRINTVYELLRADPAAALFPGRRHLLPSPASVASGPPLALVHS